MSDRFKMRWPKAVSDTAQMIEHEVIRYWTVKQFVHHPMGWPVCPVSTDTDTSVTILFDVTRPQPTLTVERQMFEETNDNRNRRTTHHHGNNIHGEVQPG